MDKYYYMVSQLPALAFGKKAIMDSVRFLEEARKWLGRSDLKKLAGARLLSFSRRDGEPSTLRRYKVFEERFRRELAQWRTAKKSGQEYRPSLFSPALVQEGNPLDVELNLLRFRWDFLTSFEQYHHFDLDYLILYYLKLQILEQEEAYDPDEGMQIFQKLARYEYYEEGDWKDYGHQR